MIMAKRLSTANVRKTNPLLQCWKLLAASAAGNGQQTGLVEVFELNLLLKYISLVTFTHTHTHTHLQLLLCSHQSYSL